MNQDQIKIDFFVDKESPQPNTSPDSMLKKRNINFEENQYFNKESADYLNGHNIEKKSIIENRQDAYSLVGSLNTQNQAPQEIYYLYPFKLIQPIEKLREKSYRNLPIEQIFPIEKKLPNGKKLLVVKSQYPDTKHQDTKPTNSHSNKTNSKAHDFAKMARELKIWTNKYRRKQKYFNKGKKAVKRSASQESRSIKKEHVKKESGQDAEDFLLKSEYAETVSSQSNKEVIRSENDETENNINEFLNQIINSDEHKNVTGNINKDTGETEPIESKWTRNYKKEYSRMYNIKNKEKVKKQARLRYINNKAKFQKYSLDNRKDHLERLKWNSKEYYWKNKEKLLEYKESGGKIPTDHEIAKTIQAKKKQKSTTNYITKKTKNIVIRLQQNTIKKTEKR